MKKTSSKSLKSIFPAEIKLFFLHRKETEYSFELSVSICVFYYAPINVKPGGGGRGGEGRIWGGDLTFFKNLQSYSLPTGKSFQSIATKFPHPGLHIAVKYPKAEPKKKNISK